MLHEQPQHLSVHHVRLHVYSFLSSLLPVSLHDVFKSVEVRCFSGRRSPDLYVVVQTACSKYREVWMRLQYVNLKGNKKQPSVYARWQHRCFTLKGKYHEKFYNKCNLISTLYTTAPHFVWFLKRQKHQSSNGTTSYHSQPISPKCDMWAGRRTQIYRDTQNHIFLVSQIIQNIHDKKYIFKCCWTKVQYHHKNYEFSKEC